MTRLALALWFVLAGLAAAAPVVVQTGEHDGFTRLVLEIGAPLEWKVGRTADGYEMRVANQSPSYDLSGAFKAIGKSRLAAIWADPESTTLHIGIACACHAIPFEFRPGIVVIDLRDGPPPKGSSFELALDGSEQPLPKPKPKPKPLPAPAEAVLAYDWTKQALEELHGAVPAAARPGPAKTPPSSDPALEGLRTSLLHQMSRGASQGVVDMVDPKSVPDPSAPAQGDAFASVRIGLGELPGVSLSEGLPDHDGLAADGRVCIPADQLDVANWGDTRPVSLQMAEATAGLLGEFDRPDHKALGRAVRFDLFIGFGAEARQRMHAFPADLPDMAIWTSMARLIDGEADPNSAFAGQTACDTPAALWAILADARLGRGAKINADAAYLAFSALPPALRRQLGPTLADRFLAVADMASARKIRDAILRAPGEAGPQVSLMEAELDMSNGAPAAAEAKLAVMVANSGPGTAAALVALLEARVAQDLPVEPDLVTALEAVLQEQSGTEVEAPARRALLLARAAAGDFDAAFAALPLAPSAELALWRLLSKIGQDDAILLHAVRQAGNLPPKTDAETAARLAARLLALGLAESALFWVPDEAQVDPTLLAQIHLQRHDGRGTLRALTGADSPEARLLRAQALQQLGDEAAAGRVFAEAGDADAEWRAISRAQDWADLAQRGPDPWKSVAAVLQPVSGTSASLVAGPLAQGKQLAESSAATRTAVAALLASVAKP